MELLSDDPTYLVLGLGGVAAAFLIALRVTQRGKYMLAASAALGLALVVLVVERAWVTDAERVEQVVEDLRRAVEASDVDGVARHLTPDVEYVQAGRTVGSARTRDFIRSYMERTRFDFVRVGGLKTTASARSRRGTAEFRVTSKGTLQASMGQMNVGAANSQWSLGLQETEPEVWKVNRISPMNVPPGMASP